MSARAAVLGLVAAGLLTAGFLLAPYPSREFVRADGAVVRVPPPERLGHAADVWDYLQIARQMHRGEGLTSLFTYVPFLPESVQPGTTPETFPVYWRQPGYPALIAAGFSLLGDEEPNAMLAVQAVAVTALPVIVFFLARLLLPVGWSAVAGLLALWCPLILGVRDPLVATPLYAALVPLLFLAVLKAKNFWGWVIAGAVLGLSAWFRLETWLLLPGLVAAFLLAHEKDRRRGFIVIAAAAFVVVLPWHLRLVQLTGSPVYNAVSLLFHDTEAFPQWSASRSLLVRELSPLGFVLAHPGEITVKAVVNLLRWGRDLLLLPNPASVPFWLLAFFRPPEDRRARALLAGTALAGLSAVAVLAPMEYAARFLAGFVPLLAVAAALGLSRLPLGARPAGIAALGVAVLMTGTALYWRADHVGTAGVSAENFNRLYQPGRYDEVVLLTDAPTVYAWIWNRPAVWAPVPAEVHAVRERLHATAAVVTCSAGTFDGMEHDLVPQYAAQGARGADGPCPWYLTWPAGAGQ